MSTLWHSTTSTLKAKIWEGQWAKQDAGSKLSVLAQVFHIFLSSKCGSITYLYMDLEYECISGFIQYWKSSRHSWCRLCWQVIRYKSKIYCQSVKQLKLKPRFITVVYWSTRGYKVLFYCIFLLWVLNPSYCHTSHSWASSVEYYTGFIWTLFQNINGKIIQKCFWDEDTVLQLQRDGGVRMSLWPSAPSHSCHWAEWLMLQWKTWLGTEGTLGWI